jgi:hypothetical protein
MFPEQPSRYPAFERKDPREQLEERMSKLLKALEKRARGTFTEEEHAATRAALDMAAEINLDDPAAAGRIKVLEKAFGIQPKVYR